MSIADDILDATLRHSIYLERHKAKTVRDILALLRDVEGAIQADLLRVDLDAMSRRDLDRLLGRLRKSIADGYEPIIALLDSEIKGLGEYEGQWQVGMFRNTVPVRLDFIAPAAEQIYAAAVARPFQGLLLREWYQGLPDGQFRRLRAAIRNGFVEGRTTQQIVREIIGTKKQAGIIEQSRRGAEAATRTALAHTANVARNEVYRANKVLIKGVEWVSTLDGRTTFQCMALDGKMFPADSGPRPPVHVNCRSSTIPVLKSAKQLGLKNIPKSTRASMNGQVSGELNYDAWLRTQGNAFQDEVLGPTRADLFRAGLKMDRFVDQSGKELTLNQLRETEAAFWAKAKATD